MINRGYEKYRLNNSFYNYTKEEINKIINQINFLYIYVTPIVLSLLLICYVITKVILFDLDSK